MTLAEVLELNIHNDGTIIEIVKHDGDYDLRYRGYWYEDHIMKFENKEIEKFEWEEDGDIKITLKEESEGEYEAENMDQ